MALKSLGLVTVPTPGTPVRLTDNAATPADRVAAHSVSAQAWHANTGLLYIGDRSTMVRATGVGVVMVLAIPTANAIAQFTATIVNSPAGLNPTALWVDADVADEGVLVSLLEA